MLLDLWHALGATSGAPLPVLVLAGRENLPGFAERARPLRAAGKLVLLDRPDDVELAWLYRHCRFTLFPSLAEGYGLPVAESLAFGKRCIASDLPEESARWGVGQFGPPRQPRRRPGRMQCAKRRLVRQGLARYVPPSPGGTA